MKILMLTSWPVTKPEGSGMSTFYETMRTGLEKNGFVLQLWNPDIPFGNYFRHTLTRIYRNFRVNRELKHYDHAIVFKLDYDGFFLKKRNLPHIVSPRGIFIEIAPTEHGLFKLFLYIQAWLEKLNLNRSDLIIVPSEYARSCIKNKYGIDHKIVVIPNGIDLKTWDSVVEKENQNPCDYPYILSVANFYPRKRIPLLIRAFRKVAIRDSDIKLILVGDGIEFERCRDLVGSLGLEDRVIFTGLIRDRQKIVAYFKHCHIFCHTSHQETFGNVLLEAMASSKPVVAINACAIPEIITADKTGLLVPPDDENALSEAMKKLSGDNSLCENLGRNAREAVTGFSIERMQGEYAGVFKRLWEEWVTG
jgi:glycosyltransferase involved in cell wall biosynthesis